MWRLITLASLLFILAAGSPAEAGCRLCVESITAQATGGSGAGWGKSFDLRVVARAADQASIPGTATAVVMQVDGDRSKCLTVSLVRSGIEGGLVTYSGSFTGYGQATHSGRLALGDEVYDFTVPLNGEPGRFKLIEGAAATQTIAQRPIAVVPAPAIQATVAPTVAPIRAAAQPASAREREAAAGLSVPDQQGILIGIGVVAFVAGSVLLERRRSAADRTEGVLEA